MCASTGACRLALCGHLFGVFLREMVADGTPADCTEHGVVSGVVTGDAASDSTFQAAGGMRGSGCTEREGGGDQERFDFALFHDGEFFCFG